MKRESILKMINTYILLVISLIIAILIVSGCNRQKEAKIQSLEMYRPLIHFSPQEKWMNDPNGMVFWNGEYHLFYQYYPDSTVWGPMHWGHAISKDMVIWEHMPIALYPDEHGLIFSGSAVIDHKNTSGFGTDGNPAMVAIFTYHNMEAENAGAINYQTQGIAYSTNNGRTWTKYENNPVLMNPGIKDFRDPKVIWHQESNKWIMALAVKDHIGIYSSPDLKEWTHESDFGKELGAHDGVWECPDLFPLKVEDSKETKWIMLVSLTGGGPNGGSATQYFVGDFNGKDYSTEQQTIKWLDYGTDNYAGVTWSNTGDKKYFIGWMNNWKYATVTPTKEFRGSMTTSRELKLKKTNTNFLLYGYPLANYQDIVVKTKSIADHKLSNDTLIHSETLFSGANRIKISITSENGTSGIGFGNSKHEKVWIKWNRALGEVSIDRRIAGLSAFHDEFAQKISAPFVNESKTINLDIIIDNSSVELFLNEGELQITAQVFPTESYTSLESFSEEEAKFTSIEISHLSSNLTTDQN